jgi:tellurite resistance protein TehA-like permease
MSRTRMEAGQASVELVAILPLVAVVAFGLWQAGSQAAGTVRIRLAVPSVVGAGRLATFTSTAHFAPQR